MQQTTINANVHCSSTRTLSVITVKPTLTRGSQPAPCSARRQHRTCTKNCQADGCCSERLLPLPPPLATMPASRPSRSCFGCCRWLRAPASSAATGPVGLRAASLLKPRRSQKNSAAASYTLSARALQGWRTGQWCRKGEAVRQAGHGRMGRSRSRAGKLGSSEEGKQGRAGQDSSTGTAQGCSSVRAGSLVAVSVPPCSPWV